jgi:hypothetical protein
VNLECNKVRGALEHPGLVAVSDRGIFFRPSRSLDRIFGASELRMASDDIVRVTLTGIMGRKVQVSGDQEFLFSGTQMERLRDAVGKAMLSTLRSRTLDEIVLSEEVATALMSSRGSALEGEERLLLAGPVVRAVADQAFEHGTAVFTSARALFFPQDDADSTLAVKLDELVESRREGSSTGLMLSDGGEPLVLPGGGVEGFNDQAWALVRQELDRIAVEKKNLEYLKALLGMVSFVRLTRDHDELVSLRPGFVLDLNDGLGIILTERCETRLKPGSMLRLEVGRKKGVYEVRCKVLRMDDLPKDLPREVRGGISALKPPPTQVVVLAPAESVEFANNRRKAYRLTVLDSIRARRLQRDEEGRWFAVGEEFEIRLRDLSYSGCGLALTERMEVGERLKIEFDVVGDAVPFQAEVVHLKGANMKDGTRCHGFRFVGLNEAMRERLQQEVLRRQTEQNMAKRRREDEAELLA